MLVNCFIAKPSINPLTEKLKLAFRTGMFSDITFCFPGSAPADFKLHKFVLSVKCDYFSELLRGKYQNSRAFNLCCLDKWHLRKKISFNNPNLKAEAFRAVVEFLYTNTLNIGIELADSLVSPFFALTVFQSLFL